MRLDFFIAGVQKAGTTALDTMLRQHPSIQMARQKEVHFFDNEDMDWANPAYGRLHEQFDWTVKGVVRGEATPIYTYWPNALERLAAYNSAAKVIICLRHPSLRAFSHWRMAVTRKFERLPFCDAIRSGRSRFANLPAHRWSSYVERGFYAPQVRRLLDLFGRNNVAIVRTDHLWADPTSVLALLCAFLGVHPIAPVLREYIVKVESTGMGSMPPGDLAYLNALYETDIRETAGLTGIYLSDWLDPNYDENIQPVDGGVPGMPGQARQ